MPLVKATLKTKIKNLLSDMKTKEEVSDDEFAEKLSTAIDSYIKSATITVSGVVTAGSSSTQTQTSAVIAKIT